jgi:hypothetical protein
LGFSRESGTEIVAVQERTLDGTFSLFRRDWDGTLPEAKKDDD